MAETYHLGNGRKFVNLLVKLGLVYGFGQKNSRLLSVRGRRSGKLYSTPVILMVRDESEWLVAPYGATAWVKNLRVSRRGSLRKGKRVREISVEELPAADAGPVIRQYVELVPITRKFWNVTPDSSDEAFVAEVATHPVFLIRDAT